jgi:hypothetical protein
MPLTGRTSARSTTSTNLNTASPTSPQGLANIIVTALTDFTTYIQDAYQARIAEARRKKEEAEERALSPFRTADDDDDQSLMGDREAEEG